MEKMIYDFDTPTDRRLPDAVKWNVGEGVLPMWVADMDFPCAPEIKKALQTRLDHGVFGYGDIPAEWYDAYVSWWRRRYGVTLDREAMIFSTGVVPIISSVVRKLTTPNENVVLLTPVYNIFYNSVVNNGARVLESRLKYEDGNYSIDWSDLEAKLADPQSTLMILCNPHNPIGKIWDRQTLARIGRLAAENGVTVISDEIHCDIVRPGCRCTPFFSVDDLCRRVSVTCIAPTKAFNLAGLQTACAYVPEPFLRHKVVRALNTDEVAEPNAFAVTAAVAAFTKGEAWLDAACAYLFENRDVAEGYIRENITALRTVRGDATYLLWIDLSSLPCGSTAFCAHLKEHAKLILSDGASYGAGGEHFLRLNLACPRATLLDGLDRLKRGVASFNT